MTDSWQNISNAYELGQFLIEHDMFNENMWRQLHCKSLRRVWDLIPDETVKRAIEIAEQYCKGRASDADLEAQHYAMSKLSDSTWEVVFAMRLNLPENEFEWPVLDTEVDAAWVAHMSAVGAKVATQKQLNALDLPEPAASVYAWATATRDALAKGIKDDEDLAKRQWAANHDAEERRQADLLRSMVKSPLSRQDERE